MDRQEQEDGTVALRWPALVSAAPPRPPWRVVLGLTALSVLGLAAIAGLAHVTGRPLFIPPLAATIALIASVPEGPLAQPRNVVGGHLVSCLVGGLVAAVLGHGLEAATLAGGLAVGATAALRVLHSPAAATAVLVALEPTPLLSFTVLLVVTTSLLVLLGVAEARVRGRSYPRYWW